MTEFPIFWAPRLQTCQLCLCPQHNTNSTGKKPAFCSLTPPTEIPHSSPLCNVDLIFPFLSPRMLVWWILSFSKFFPLSTTGKLLNYSSLLPSFIWFWPLPQDINLKHRQTPFLPEARITLHHLCKQKLSFSIADQHNPSLLLLEQSVCEHKPPINTEAVAQYH